MGIRLNFSLAYHPQTDGQSEIVNSIILDLLKIKEAITASQHKQKRVVDKHIRPLEFNVDDWVILKFSKAWLRHTIGKDWQGEPTGH